MSSAAGSREVCNSCVPRINLRVDENGCGVDVPQNMQHSNAPSNQQNQLLPPSPEREPCTSISDGYNSAVRRQGNLGNNSGSTSSLTSLQPVSLPLSHHSNPPVYNWQAAKTTIKERLAFMFNNETLSDVHFIVGRDTQQQRIPAHKFILSVGSAVFDAMFNGTLATQSNEIELPDVEPDAFFSLLRLVSDFSPISLTGKLRINKKIRVQTL